ncbi:MAG: hypothetical protein ACLR8U_06120 [Oscillospiraceae bacterium]
MLDERDLQAIAQLIDSKLQESEQRTVQLIDSKLQESEQRTSQLIDSKLKESEQRTMGAIKESEQRTMGAIKESEQRTMGAIKESEQRTMGAIKESEQRTMQGAAALMESYFEPKFQLLAEGIQSLQETQIPRERFENLEEEVAFLHTIVRQHSREIEKLKHA